MANEILSITSTDIVPQQQIESLIYTVRGVQVMLDRDLAMLYKVETKALNQAVKRNSIRFPEDFMFQLTKEEWNNLRSQNVTLDDFDSLRSQNVTSKSGRGGVRYLPYVFTEEGVGQLS